MENIHSLAHTKWNCKYHIVFAPKYRRKVFYEQERYENRANLEKIMKDQRSEFSRSRSLSGLHLYSGRNTTPKQRIYQNPTEERFGTGCSDEFGSPISVFSDDLPFFVGMVASRLYARCLPCVRQSAICFLRGRGGRDMSPWEFLQGIKAY